jgi:hypothetical protein
MRDRKPATSPTCRSAASQAVDLGYQKGDAVSNLVTRIDDTAHTQVYLQLFNQIWNDEEKVSDVTAAICDHIESVYQKNSPERIYFTSYTTSSRTSSKSRSGCAAK